jgi:hypothetical protein
LLAPFGVLTVMNLSVLLFGDAGYDVWWADELPNVSASAQTQLLRRVTLHGTAFGALVLGGWVSQASQEMLRSAFGWSLPALRRGLFMGTTLLLPVVALLIYAFVAWRTDDRTAWQAAGMGTLWFAMPSLWLLIGRWKMVDLWFLLVGMLPLLPPVYVPLLDAMPLALLPAVTILSAAALLVAFDADSVRNWLQSSTRPAAAQTSDGIRPIPAVRAVRRSVQDWVRALYIDERQLWSTAHPFAISFLGALLLGTLLYFTQIDPWVVVLWTQSPTAMGGQFPLYPVSRSTRAEVTYRGHLMDTLWFSAGLALTCGFFAMMHVPLPAFALREAPDPAWGLHVGVVLACLPIVQWGRRRDTRDVTRLTHIPRLMGCMAVALGTGRAIRAFAAPTWWIPITIALLVLGQLLYRHALHRYFATADLLPVRRAP